MSMIREATDGGVMRRLRLIYGSRDPMDIIFREALGDRAARHAQLQVTLVVSDPPPGYTGRCGFMTGQLRGDFSAKTFYLCGPELMYAFCGGELAKLGIPASCRSGECSLYRIL
jgi:ferredoxin-NADP reductase